MAIRDFFRIRKIDGTVEVLRTEHIVKFSIVPSKTYNNKTGRNEVVNYKLFVKLQNEEIMLGCAETYEEAAEKFNEILHNNNFPQMF